MIEFDVYGVKVRLHFKKGKYTLLIGNDGEVKAEVDGRTPEELARAALPFILERCGDKCRGVAVADFVLSEIRLAIQEMQSSWYVELVSKWKGYYDEVEVVRTDEKLWLYTAKFSGRSNMIVKEYQPQDGVIVPSRVVYCGPAMFKTKSGEFYILKNGCLVEIATQEVIHDVLMKHAGGSCYDVDIGAEVATKVPAHRHESVHLAARLPFERDISNTIDWEEGRDWKCLLRTGDPEETARVLKKREEVLKKYYGPNYYAALAIESLYIPSALAWLMREDLISTAVLYAVYAYGPAGVGKSLLARSLAAMWCSTRRCKQEYFLYTAGPMNENRVRNALDLEGPAFVADEQPLKKVVELLNMFFAATSDEGGAHAARYGRGFGYRFEVRRPLMIITNSPYEEAIREVAQANREAAKRRTLVVPWADHKIDDATGEQLRQELAAHTPPVFNFVQRVYLACKNRLSNASNYLKFGITFWQCASEVYKIDYSERIRALEWLASVQDAEKAQHETDALEELWATVKAHYRADNDKRALLQLLNDAMVVVYTRDTRNKWEEVFRAICGQSLDTVTEAHALVVEVAKCLYNIDFQSVEEVERLLGDADVELVKKIASLKAAGVYPWIRSSNWLIPQSSRAVAGVKGVPDPTRKDEKGKTIYRYDLFPLFLKLIFAEHQEEPESKGESQTMSSENLVHTFNTFHTGGEHSMGVSSAPSGGQNSADSSSAELKEPRQENSPSSTAQSGETSAQELTLNTLEPGMKGIKRMSQISPGHTSSRDGALDTNGNPAQQSGIISRKRLHKDDILRSV